MRSIAVARLPSSFRSRNQTTREFREQYAKLPAQIRKLVKGACVFFNENENHPSLRLHRLDDTSTGQHRPDSFSVSITMKYRAIFVKVDGEVNVWYWIGTHAEYDRYAGR